MRIGTAGWSIASADAAHFPAEGTALERYSRRFNAVEVNSSFHRPHRLSTWQRWAASVPDDFLFSVKLPKTISHQHKLIDCDELLDTFLDDVAGLGGKLGVLLLQLPPKLAFDGPVQPFMDRLAAVSPAPIACEPRHASWFDPSATTLLEQLHIARVAADPAPIAGAGVPAGYGKMQYWRLHGSPQMYRSSYADRIGDFADALRLGRAKGANMWCLFDNTASSAATGDALALCRAVAPS